VLFGTRGTRFKLKKNSGMIFTEKDKEKLLKFEGKSWSELIDPYLVQISDLDSDLRWQTLELNTRLKGSHILKTERLANYHGLDARFPFLDNEILNIASFLTRDEKKSMFLFEKLFADHISKFNMSEKKCTHKIPLEKWIRNELYENIKEVFEQDVVHTFFDTEILFTMLENHRKGFRDLSGPLWAVTMFVIWLQEVVK
jgi:asparagine synthase (glutamine-hydrolysing)